MELNETGAILNLFDSDTSKKFKQFKLIKNMIVN